MIRFIRSGLVLSAIVAAWSLSGCTPSSAPTPPTPMPGSTDNGCPKTLYSHPDDKDDIYVAIPSEVSGEKIDDVLIPGGKPVGCENPRVRLVHGTEQDAKNLFDRLTKDAPRGYTQGRVAPHFLRGYGAGNFLTDIRIRKIDGVAVGWRTHIECRRPLVWIFQWPDESSQKPGVKPVLLEFTDEPAAEHCHPLESKDADGGGP
jgi:hypothetical protein